MNEKKSQSNHNEAYYADQLRFLWLLNHEPDVNEPVYVKESN